MTKLIKKLDNDKNYEFFFEKKSIKKITDREEMIAEAVKSNGTP